MDKQKLVSELGAIVGADKVVTDADVIKTASRDYIGFRTYEWFDGQDNVPRAACVVKPQNTEDVSKILSALNANLVDVVPRTGGSSVTMGIEPQPGGVIIDGSDMNEIIEVDTENMWVTARCGTPMAYIEDYLQERGYTTGHSPQSLPLAHVGGLLATRSIGQFSTLYGGIEDMVVGLEAVLADGEVVRIKNNPRRSVGPDLRHLFIGSEGTLAFITEATLKIHKYRPETRWMNAYGIRGMKNGLEFIREIMTDGYRPAVVRLHDETEVVSLFHSVVPEGYCLLLLLADGPKAITEATGAAITEALKKYDVIDMGKKPVESWLKTRNDVSFYMDEPTYYSRGAVADTCEISAPWSVIGEIHEAVKERLPREMENLVSIGGHSSHSYTIGTNIYFTFGFLKQENVPVAEDYIKLVSVIMEETLKRGGSIAHHHGSGKYRTRWMPQEHGTSYSLMYKLKDMMDPNHILNKGVILAEKD